jgi:hypothetical protein
LMINKLKILNYLKNLLTKIKIKFNLFNIFNIENG